MSLTVAVAAIKQAWDFLHQLDPQLIPLAARAVQDMAQGKDPRVALTQLERDALASLAQRALDKALGEPPKPGP